MVRGSGGTSFAVEHLSTGDATQELANEAVKCTYHRAITEMKPKLSMLPCS